MPFKPKTPEFEQYVDRVISRINKQSGIFMTDSNDHNQVDLLGAALAEFAEELKKEAATREDGLLVESFSKAIATLQAVNPPVSDRNTRRTISQALETLQGLSEFLEDNNIALTGFSKRQSPNVQDAIKEGFSPLSRDLELDLDLEEEKEDEQEQEDAAEEENLNQIIEEQPNNQNNIIENNNIIIENNDNNNIINDNNNINIENPRQNEQPIQENPAYTFEQFQQIKAQGQNETYLMMLNRNFPEFITTLNDPYISITYDAKKVFQEKLPGYVNAIQTILDPNITKERYDNAVKSLADFPEFLKTRLNGQSMFSRLYELGRQKLMYWTSDDMAEELAALDQLTNLGLKSIPGVERMSESIAQVKPPVAAQVPQPEQINVQQNAPNLNQENADNPNLENNQQIIQENLQENANANPENNNLAGNGQLPEQIIQQNENVIIENANENGPQNQDAQNGLNQEEVPEPQPVPAPPAPAHAVLNTDDLREPAARLKALFKSVAKTVGSNAGPQHLTGEMRVKLPQFASAIATLGTEGQSVEAYQQAANTLQQLKPLLLKVGSTGNMGYEYLSKYCGAFNGACPNEQSLKDDLQALNGALHLGLDTLEQDVAQQRSLRGRKIEDIFNASKPVTPDSLNRIPEDHNQRTALEHLNALYASLKAYDDAHPQAPQFTQLLEHLNTIRQCTVAIRDPRHGNSLIRQGTMARDLQAAAVLLQDDDQTITEGLDKAAARDLLYRAAAAMHINPNNFVPENVYNEVVAAENAYVTHRDEAIQQENQLNQRRRERFGNDYGEPRPYALCLSNSINRVTDHQFEEFPPAKRMNGMIGMFALAQIMAESPRSADEVLEPERVDRTADALAANPTFTNLITQNMEQIRTAARTNGWKGIMKFIQNKALEMADLPDALPAAFLPEAIDLTHDRIEKAKLPAFRQKPLPDKVHTLAQILAAREVVGSTRNKKHSLEKSVGQKIFARTRELEQCQTFRQFVESNEDQIIRSLHGRTHGGAMEDLFKSFVRSRGYLPDDIPVRFMPTALERIEDIQRLIKSNQFRNLAADVKQGIYAELMATRLAVNSVRNTKSSLNFQLNGEELAKARELIVTDHDMVRALADREMLDAAKTGHGGHMEEIAARYNCKNVLKENLPPRYQPTAKEWIQHQLRKLSDGNLLDNDAARYQASARILATLEAYGDNLNTRIGQNGPDARALNARSEALANDEIYHSICANGGLPSDLELGGARNPLQLLKNRFLAQLNASQAKPLDGSFTRLSPPRNQAQNQQPAAPAPVDSARHFEKVKALFAKHLQGGQNVEFDQSWRKLNPRTVKRALAEIAVCAVQNQNGALTEQTLMQKSTKLMESKEWLNLFAGKSIQELQELVTNADNPEHCMQAINDALHAAQPQAAPQVQQGVAQQIDQPQQVGLN